MNFAKLMGASALALGLVLTPAVAAQQGQQGQAPAPQTKAPSTEQVMKMDLKAYARTAIELQKINNKHAQKFQQAEGQEEKQQIQQKMRQKMVGAIKEGGLTLESYNTIATAAKQDKKVYEKVMGYVKEFQNAE